MLHGKKSAKLLPSRDREPQKEKGADRRTRSMVSGEPKSESGGSMSTTVNDISPGEKKPGEAWIPMEFATCTNCEATIRRECIVAKIIDKHQLGPTRQNIRAYCEHCDTMIELTRELRGGVWTIIEAPHVVSDESRRQSFLARIAHERGIIQEKKKAG